MNNRKGRKESKVKRNVLYIKYLFSDKIWWGLNLNKYNNLCVIFLTVYIIVLYSNNLSKCKTG
jgi:hypothetical protein